MSNLVYSNTLFELEVTIDKLSALYSLFAAEYIDTSVQDNKARAESRAAVGCILFDLISEAHGLVADLIAQESAKLTKEKRQ